MDTTAEAVNAATSAASQVQSKAIFRFFDLPRELRDMVYEKLEHRSTMKGKSSLYLSKSTIP